MDFSSFHDFFGKRWKIRKKWVLPKNSYLNSSLFTLVFCQQFVISKSKKSWKNSKIHSLIYLCLRYAFAFQHSQQSEVQKNSWKQRESRKNSSNMNFGPKIRASIYLCLHSVFRQQSGINKSKNFVKTERKEWKLKKLVKYEFCPKIHTSIDLCLHSVFPSTFRNQQVQINRENRLKIVKEVKAGKLVKKGKNNFDISSLKDLITFIAKQGPHYSKSQIFVQKFNFDKTSTFSRVFHQKHFWQFFLVKSKLSTAKKSKTTTFSRIFHPKNRQFSREIKVEFLDKKWRFRTVCYSEFNFYLYVLISTISWFVPSSFHAEFGLTVLFRVVY